MRLTLRTLLAYLDDMLEPAQAKVIGAKVAESEHAREQMERIKQVTRRRRLTTPPASGPGGIDPNTIAEYLDNEVTPETAAEVEQICLASDVHLAEVAACHQILTLVLGEPALVPPSAKARMVALVKGPEAIPVHKHKATRKHKDQDLSSSDYDLDTDDSLRLGVPVVGRDDRKKLWIIVGSGVLAACLLIVALWQLVSNLPSNEPNPKPDPIAQNDDRTKTESKDNKEKKDKVEPPPAPMTDKDKKDKDKGGTEPVPIVPKDNGTQDKDKKAKKDDDPTLDKDKKKQQDHEFKQPEVVPVKIDPLPQIEYKPASAKLQPVGKYVSPTAKAPGILLQLKPEERQWVNFVGKNPPVFSGRSLLSLGGSKSALQLDSGVEVMLWGNLMEATYDPLLFESRATLHVNDQLDADLTLERGRIVVRNFKKDKNALVRVRFENPTLAEESHLDLVLAPEAAAALERVCEFPVDEPFIENAKDKMRKGPVASVRVFAMAKTVRVRHEKKPASTLEEGSKVFLEWQSRRGKVESIPAAYLPLWLTGLPEPKTPEEKKFEIEQLAARKKAMETANLLVRSLDSKAIDVALEEVFQYVQKEYSATRKFSPELYYPWRHAIQSAAAVDDIGRVFDEFQQETTPLMVRGLCIQTMQLWLAWDRDNEYLLYNVLQKRFRKSESIKIMELFHPISREEAARRPEQCEHLLEGLNNDLLPIRVLSHWHLLRLAPMGVSIKYDPAAPRNVRQPGVAEWHRLMPRGQLPEMAPMKKEPTKKDKGK